MANLGLPDFAHKLHFGGASDRTVFDETYKGEAPDLSAVLGDEA
jgi:hypothetical protein